MDTVTAFLAHYGTDGFDLALLIAEAFCAAVLGAFAVGHLAAAIAQCGAGRALLMRCEDGYSLPSNSIQD